MKDALYMNVKMFEHIMNDWRHLTFSKIVVVRHNKNFEIYASYGEHEFDTKLLICKTHDSVMAEQLFKLCRKWLHDFNATKSRKL